MSLLRCRGLQRQWAQAQLRSARQLQRHHSPGSNHLQQKGRLQLCSQMQTPQRQSSHRRLQDMPAIKAGTAG